MKFTTIPAPPPPEEYQITLTREEAEMLFLILGPISDITGTKWLYALYDNFRASGINGRQFQYTGNVLSRR